MFFFEQAAEAARKAYLDREVNCCCVLCWWKKLHSTFSETLKWTICRNFFSYWSIYIYLFSNLIGLFFDIFKSKTGNVVHSVLYKEVSCVYVRCSSQKEVNTHAHANYLMKDPQVHYSLNINRNRTNVVLIFNDKRSCISVSST